MGHVLHAVIGQKAPVGQFAGRWRSAYLVGLPQGYALVPLTESLHDEIAAAGQSELRDPFPLFVHLSASVENVLKEASAVGSLAYIETDYFGGCGTQMAVAWDRGELVGPFKTETTWNGSNFVVDPPGEWAINRALATLGVVPTAGKDAFDTVGLGRLRVTESVAEDVA
jgi:hypothetical protein